jgi:hypothetical protein
MVGGIFDDVCEPLFRLDVVLVAASEEAVKHC